MALTRSEIRKIVEEEQVRKLIRKRRWDTDRLWEFFREKEEESVHLEGFWSRDLSRVIASGGVVGILYYSLRFGFSPLLLVCKPGDFHGSVSSPRSAACAAFR